MVTAIAAVVNNGVVENIIVIEPIAIPLHKEAMGCDYLIAVTDAVQIGETYDEEQSIFLRDGARIYPEKTDSERIADIEIQISEMQDAFVELGDIIAASDGASDSGEDGGTDG